MEHSGMHVCFFLFSPGDVPAGGDYDARAKCLAHRTTCAPTRDLSTRRPVTKRMMPAE
jgi:hypothetical protein